jgi:hypothetical protein
MNRPNKAEVREMEEAAAVAVRVGAADAVVLQRKAHGVEADRLSRQRECHGPKKSQKKPQKKSGKHKKAMGVPGDYNHRGCT